MLLFQWIYLNIRFIWFLNHFLFGRESVNAQTSLDNISSSWHTSVPEALSPHIQHTLTGTQLGQNSLFPCILPLCHCRHLKAELPSQTIKWISCSWPSRKKKIIMKTACKVILREHIWKIILQWAWSINGPLYSVNRRHTYTFYLKARCF